MNDSQFKNIILTICMNFSLYFFRIIFKLYEMYLENKIDLIENYFYRFIKYYIEI